MREFSPNHIDTSINKNWTNEWRFTGFYGEQATQKRHESLAKLRQLKNRGVSPWLCAREFNEITRQSKKKNGGRLRPHGQMQLFRDVVNECAFMDLGFVGFPFTWHKHFADCTIWERLVRVMATNEWFSMFPGTKVQHLDTTTSDHKPLLINLEGMESNFQKPFCFKHMWMTEKGCGKPLKPCGQKRTWTRGILKC